MPLSFIFLLVLLVISFDYSGKKFLHKYVGTFFWSFVLLVFVHDSLTIRSQYLAWKGDNITQFFLPEYQPGYFTSYSFYRVLAPHLIAFLAALILIYVMIRLNGRKKGMLFEKEEPYLAGLSLFMTNYPGLLIFLALLMLIYLVWHFSSYFKLKDVNERLPLYTLWPSVALLTVVLSSSWLSQTSWWKLLEI